MESYMDLIPYLIEKFTKNTESYEPVQLVGETIKFFNTLSKLFPKERSRLSVNIFGLVFTMDTIPENPNTRVIEMVDFLSNEVIRMKFYNKDKCIMICNPIPNILGAMRIYSALIGKDLVLEFITDHGKYTVTI